MSLIARLCILVVVAMLPALAVQVRHEVSLRRQGEEQVRAQALRLAQSASGETGRILEGARTLLVALARHPAVLMRDGPACSAQVAALERALPSFRHIVALDGDGRPFCGAAPPPPPAAPGSDPARLRDAMAAGRLTVGGLAGASGGRDLHVSLPFAGPDGAPAGVVALGIDLDWLGGYFAAKSWPTDGSISIIDRSGTILVRQPGPELVGRTMPEGFRWMLEAAAPGTTEGVGPDGIARIGGYVPPAVSAGGLLVSVALSKEEALADLNRALRRDLLLIAGGLAFALAAAVVGGRLFIRRPVDRLLAAADRWRRGDYAARAGLRDQGSEIHRLGGAVDAMAEALEAREAELRRSAERQRTLMTELNHRAKNLLAVVRSIATLSLAGDRPLAEARQAFARRIDALAKTQDLLLGGAGASLRELVEGELRPYGERAAVRGGRDVALGSRAAQMLGLAVHELATNAAKHGALSVPDGRVEVAWALEGDGDGVPAGTLALRWRESGGPAVAEPQGKGGFGRMLVERAVPSDLKGRARLEFAPDGLRYELRASLAELAAAA